MLTQTAELLVFEIVRDRHAEADQRRMASAARHATAPPRSWLGAWREAGMAHSFRRASTPPAPAAIVPASAEC